MLTSLLRFFLPFFISLLGFLPCNLHIFLETVSCKVHAAEISHEDIIYSESTALDARAIATFQKISSHSKGILPHLPIEIRLKRTGSIQQKTAISPDGFLTVTTSFLWKSNEIGSTSDNSSTDVPCTITKSFHLSEFTEAKRCRYEINRTMNALVLYDGSTPCYISFQSKADFEQAIKIFSILINQSISFASTHDYQIRQHNLQTIEIIKEAGFSWLVALPRYDTFEEIVNFGSQANSTSKNSVLCWFTKKNPYTESEKILLEGSNISPIFIYSVSNLQETPFITLPFVGAEEPALFSTPSQAQSISSQDRSSLQKLVKSVDLLPIQFESHFHLSSPSIIMCRASDERSLKRAFKKRESLYSSSKNTIQDGQHKEKVFITINPEFYREDIPEGSTLKWLTGAAVNSDDCLRALFFKNKISPKEIWTHLYREYPSLKLILEAKSRIRKGLSIQNSLLEGMKKKEETSLNELIRSLYGSDKISYYRTKLAFLLAFEVSLLYGDATSLGENGTQYSLIILEKLGAPWSQIIAAEKLLREISPQSPHIKDLQEAVSQLEGSVGAYRSEHATPQLKPRTREVLATATLIDEAKNAYHIGVPLHDWLKMKAAFLVSLYQTEHFAAFAALSLHDLQKCISQLPNGMKNGCIAPPLGNLRIFQGMTGRPVYSAYFWEKIDSPHRDGLSLKRIREKYEEHMINHPTSEWKGRFLDWIDAKIQSGHVKLHPATKYLTAEERDSFEAVFENGILISPREFAEADEIELMFIVGLNGKMYVGQKKDAEDPSQFSFSHASFFAGTPVASSGKIVFRKGRPTLLTDHSGHYRPKRKEVIVVLRTMEKLGIDLNDFSVLHSSSATSKKLWKTGRDFLKDMQKQQENILFIPPNAY